MMTHQFNIRVIGTVEIIEVYTSNNLERNLQPNLLCTSLGKLAVRPEVLRPVPMHDGRNYEMTEIMRQAKPVDASTFNFFTTDGNKLMNLCKLK